MIINAPLNPKKRLFFSLGSGESRRGKRGCAEEAENRAQTIYFHLRDTREMTKEEEAGFLADTKGYSERYVRMFSDEKGRVKYPEKNASV